MEFGWPRECEALAREAAAFADELFEDHEPVDDAWLIGRSNLVARELGRRGWLGMTWPRAEGGHGRSPIERFAIYEELISRGVPIASSWFADRQIGPSLLAYGTPEQRRRWIPEIVAGASMWCIGLSEPDAGSDVASIRTRAERCGARWVISGTKIWTSGAQTADWCYLVARTNPDAPAHRGLSEFVVDMHDPGVSVAPIRDATGDRHFCEVRFEDVVVDDARRVGEVDGSFRQIMRQLEHERGGIDRLVSNRALFRAVCESPLCDQSDPAVRAAIAAIEGGYRVGRLLVLREVLGQAPPGYSALTKTICTEFEQRVASFCARVAGPAAIAWSESDRLSGRIARNALYSASYTIMGGTTQILRNIIGERVLGLPR